MDQLQPYFSIPEVAERWRCSSSSARRILRLNGCEVFDFALRNRKGKKLIAGKELLRIEGIRTKPLR